MFTIEIGHNFETAHRLSSAGSPRKCRSIHGHSWWCTVTIEGEQTDADGLLVEFGAFKKAWRGWLDEEVDHCLVLHCEDPVAEAIRAVLPEQRLLLLPFNPTTELLARHLYEQATRVLEQVRPAGVQAWVRRVHVQETRVNAAAWEPSR